jgi:hypothetical protein
MQTMYFCGCIISKAQRGRTTKRMVRIFFLAFVHILSVMFVSYWVLNEKFSQHRYALISVNIGHLPSPMVLS